MEKIESEQMQQMLAIIRQFRTAGHFLHYNMGGCSGKRRILNVLLQRPQMLQKELQETLHIQCGSLSELLAKLEADGLVQRKKCESDARQMTVSLTEQGLCSAQALWEDYQCNVRLLMDCFSAQEQALLHSYLERMLKHWSSEDCSHLNAI